MKTEDITTNSTTIELDNYLLSNEIKNTPSLSIKIPIILKYLAVSTFILIVLNLLVIISYKMHINFPARDKFFFNQENGIPAFFSVFLILISASILGLIALTKKKDKDDFAKHWVILTVIFISLAADEMASIHEFLGDPISDTFRFTGFLKFSWVIGGVLVVAVFLFSYLKFFLALSNNMKVWFFISGATYVTGALGLEMVGGTMFVDNLDFRNQSLAYMLTTTVEETMEMIGLLLFIYTLLNYIKTYTSKIKLVVS